jgi:hypothetical protein
MSHLRFQTAGFYPAGRRRLKAFSGNGEPQNIERRIAHIEVGAPGAPHFMILQSTFGVLRFRRSPYFRSPTGT